MCVSEGKVTFNKFQIPIHYTNAIIAHDTSYFFRREKERGDECVKE